jgi:perosamine synthetase
LTDGDIRRSILEGNFGSTCEEMCNKNFIFGLVGDSSEDLFSKFNDNIKYIPILHSDRTLVKIINQEESTFIPLASPNINQEETNLVLDCLNTNMISSIGKYL